MNNLWYNKIMAEIKYSITDQLLLHLYNCMDYGFSYRAKKSFFILDKIPKWRAKIGSKDVQEGIKSLRKSKFITKKLNYDGSIIISLTDKGRLRALNVSFRRLKNKKEDWDKRWRMVTFDIPNEFKKGRDALRYRLKTAEFYEFQESLFLYPYDCEREIRDFIKLFKLENYVYFATIDYIDSQEKIKVKFGLI